MSDEIDKASDIEEYARSMQIALCKHEAARPIQTSEFCLNCDEPTEDGARWCDADCALDYSKILKRSDKFYEQR